MSVDHASGLGAPKSDPVFLHVKAGMTVIVQRGGDWRMADVIHVIGSVRSPRIPRFFQVFLIFPDFKNHRLQNFEKSWL